MYDCHGVKSSLVVELPSAPTDWLTTGRLLFEWCKFDAGGPGVPVFSLSLSLFQLEAWFSRSLFSSSFSLFFFILVGRRASVEQRQGVCAASLPPRCNAFDSGGDGVFPGRELEPDRPGVGAVEVDMVRDRARRTWLCNLRGNLHFV